MKNNNSKAINFFLVILLLTFVCYALYTVIYGTMSTTMMEYYSISTGQQGVFTTVCSIGGVAAALFCALFGERFFKPKVIVPGLITLAASTIIMIFAPPYFAVCVCSLLGGIGYTIIDIMGQSSITEYFPEKAKDNGDTKEPGRGCRNNPHEEWNRLATRHTTPQCAQH